MAVFQFLTLFCVLQLMCVLPLATAAPFDLLSSYRHQARLLDKINPDDPNSETEQRKHRSLNYKPFELKYLGTEHHTFEIMPNGSVLASRIAKPPYGALKFTGACTQSVDSKKKHKLLGYINRHRSSKIYGNVSIKGERSDKYICMDGDGVVYGSSNCTDECEFKQQAIEEAGGAPHNLYYSLRYRGFPKDPKRLNKKWYLGINKKGNVLVGHKAKKVNKGIKFIRRPVEETSGPGDGYETVTRPTVLGPTGEPDRQGVVNVATTSRPKRRRNCKRNDPLNLFRPENCSNENSRQTSGEGNSQPFSRPGYHPRRHQKRKRQRTSSRDVSINLFVIANNNKNNNEDQDR